MERVYGMPVRFVATKKFTPANAYPEREFQPGEISEGSVDNFESISRNNPGSIVEIEMTKEDWINLGTSRALACKKRIAELTALYGFDFSSPYYSVIPTSEDEKVDGTGYGGGLPDAYRKTHLLEADVARFEQQCIEQLSKSSGSTKK